MMCDQATEVEIPSNVTSIGKESDFGPGAFADCSGLREIKLREESPEKSESLLTGTGLDYLKSITIYVPIGTGYAYRHNEFFARFKEIIPKL